MLGRTLIAAALAACLLMGTASAAVAAVDRQQAVQVAADVEAVGAEIRPFGGARADVERQDDLWIVTFSARGHVRAQVEVDALTGDVVHAFTGEQAEFPLARGPQSGVAQRKLNALWIWLPLTAIFVFAFGDTRRRLSLLHLDLAAIAVMGISFAFFMDGRLRTSVPLVYPSLVYLTVRALVAGLRPRARAGPLTWLPLRALVWLTAGLVGLRILLTVADPFVLDVGYASVAGAERVLDGLDVYTRGGAHFDTYGPFAYLAYIPFVLLWPFSESQANPPAAQAAAIAFELLTVAGLVVLGRQLRPGTKLGWALALAWAACPFTALATVSASNDVLVSALLVWMLVALRSGAAAGALGGLAAAAKFAPLLVAPVFARGERGEPRRAAAYALGFVVLVLVTLVPLLPDGGLREFYDATVGFQLERTSPFSLWGLHDGLAWLQTLLKIAAAALVVVVMLVPRGRRSIAQLAGLAAAALVAAELPLEHWFYLYVPWFLPLYCLAIFSERVPAAADGRPGA